MKEFNYVIANYWEGTKQLRCYAYGSDVFYGDQKSAEAMLEYVHFMSPREEFYIVKISGDGYIPE